MNENIKQIIRTIEETDITDIEVEFDIDGTVELLPITLYSPEEIEEQLNTLNESSVIIGFVQNPENRVFVTTNEDNFPVYIALEEDGTQEHIQLFSSLSELLQD